MPCTTVDVTPDESELSVEDVTTEQIAPGDFTVSANIRNSITSGSGTVISTTAVLTVDGSKEASTGVSPGVLDTESVSFELSGLSPGSHEICVEV